MERIGSVPCSLHLIDFKKLLNVPLNQIHHVNFTLRFPVTEVDPHGNRQAKLCRHDFRVKVGQPSLADEKPHKPGEVTHHIGIALLGLQLCHLRVLKLLNGQHLSRTADFGIVENVTNLAEEHLSGRLRRQILLILCECGVVPICFCKNGMLPVFFHGGLNQSIQNFLLCRSFRSHCTLLRIAYLLLLCLPNGRLPSGRAFTKLQMTGHQVKFISFCKIPNNNERTACEYTLYRLFIRKWLRFHDCHSMQGRTRKQTNSKKQGVGCYSNSSLECND